MPASVEKTVNVTCPDSSCGQRLRVPADRVGRVRCTRCKRLFDADTRDASSIPTEVPRTSASSESAQQGSSRSDVENAKRRRARRGAFFVAAIIIVCVGWTLLQGHPPTINEGIFLTIPVLLVQTFLMALFDTIAEWTSSSKNQNANSDS